MRIPLFPRLASFLAAAALALSACGGSGGSGAGPGSEDTESRVTGRFITTVGQTLSGIHVHVEGETGMETLEDGFFSLPIPPGSVRVLGDIGLAVFLDTLVATVAGETIDLGDVEVDIQQDSDGDNVADIDEMNGYTILLNLSARRTLTSRAVTSDPGSTDTDGDGLDDGEENAALTDPRRRDSDGDLLDDAEEIYRYKSNPVDVDSDEDAAGVDGAQLANPALYDGQEVTTLGTSPTLEDTDGDGLTDYEEIVGSGHDPRVADIPSIEIVPIGSPEVVLNIERTGSTTVEQQTFVVEAETLTDSTEDVERTLREQELNVGVELSASPSLSASYRSGWTNERTLTTRSESVSENRREYTDNVTSQLDVTVKDGALRLAMEVRNVSKRTIRITDLSVIAFRVAPGSLRNRIVVGPLEPELPSGESFPAVVLPPGGTFAFVAANDHLPVSTVEALILNPGALSFEIANYTMSQVDDQGEPFRDFGATGERVLERCALVVIDLGNGDVRRSFVATSVERDPDGRSAGFGLGRAMRELLHLDVVTAPFTRREGGTLKTSSRHSLRSVTDEAHVSHVATSWASDAAAPGTARSFWLVVVTDASGAPQPEAGFASPTPPDFESIILHHGEAAYVLFVADTDGDGLSDTSEAVFGTRKDAADTDGDGLTDGVEANVGWTVNFHAGPTGSTFDSRYAYPVRSNPLLADSDGDGLSDLLELAPFGPISRDPLLADTDGDGLSDLTDPRSEIPSALLALDTDPSLLSAWSIHLDGPAFELPDAIVAELGADRRDLTYLYADATLDRRDAPDAVLGYMTKFSDRFGANDAILFEAPYVTLSLAAYASGNVPPNVTSIDNQYSYAAWVRPSRQNYDNDWLFLGESFGGSRLVLAEDDRMHGFVLLNDGSSLDVSRSYTAGIWHFVVCSVAFENGRTVVRLFGEDGALLDLKSGPIGVRPNRPSGSIRLGGFRVGGTSDPGVRTPVAALDDVRMYNRAISEELARKLFHERGYR